MNYAVDFSPDGERVVVAGVERTAFLWDWRGNQVAELNHGLDPNTAAFSPSGNLVAVGGYRDNAVVIWDVHTGKKVAVLPHDHPYPISLAFNSDSSRLAVSCGTFVYAWELSKKTLWELNAKHEILDWSDVGLVSSVDFAPGGNLLACACSGRATRLWDLDSNEARLVEHSAKSFSVSFGADRSVLATGGTDGTARIWNLESSSELTTIHMGGYKVVVKLAQGDGGRLLAIGSANGACVCIWKPEDLLAEARRRVGRELSQEEWQKFLPEEPPKHE